MKNKIIKILIPVLVLASSLYFGQFNTLVPNLPKKQDTQKITEDSKQKKDRTFWKDVFKITTRSDLKNEIDSLKTMMKNYGSEKEKESRAFEKMKDSLLVLSWRSTLKKTQKPESFLTHYDFVQEPENFSPQVVMPLRNKITITSSYGARTHPIFGTKKMHNGIDLKAGYENIYSVMDGIVTAAGWDCGGGGNFIKIKHFNRFETSYLHLSEIYYKVGEKVKSGFIIGKSGNSGNSTGPHLHFSVKEFGQSINPSHFLNDLIKVNNLIANHYEY